MKIIKLSAIDSTNRFLKQLTQETTLENYTIVVAERQTEGKGQRGASWISESDKGLAFSCLYYPPKGVLADVFVLNCIAALSVVTALQTVSSIDFQIKWPNDILAEQKKICGILIENSIRSTTEIQSIIGIGINVNQTQFDQLPQATSLALLSNKTFDKDVLLHKITTELKHNLEKLPQVGVDYFWERYHERLFKRGMVSTFEDVQGNRFVGKIVSVTKEGKLQVILDQELQAFFDIKELKMLY
jgi:BirA family biotin operon repressor/biotin-[acetyl-CoA-carboxylase] ligase